MPLNPNHPSIL